MMRSTRAEDYQELPQTIAAMSKAYAEGERTPVHSHKRAQFIYAISGTVRVVSVDAAWVVPPLRGVWMPAGILHETHARSALELRTLYIRPGAAKLPERPAVLEVSELLRALILALVAEPVDYDEAGRGGLIAALILDELRRAPEMPLELPMPRDARLLRLCAGLLDAPETDLSLDDWGLRVGASARTLARLFRRETGLRFGEWRRQARLAEASARLARGEPIGRVAAAVGYGSPSAFTAMFRRALGAAPRRSQSPRSNSATSGA